MEACRCQLVAHKMAKLMWPSQTPCHPKRTRQARMWNPGAPLLLKEKQKQKFFDDQKRSRQKCMTNQLRQLRQIMIVTNLMMKTRKMVTNPRTVAKAKSQPHVSKWSSS